VCVCMGLDLIRLMVKAGSRVSLGFWLHDLDRKSVRFRFSVHDSVCWVLVLM
jgi:hypothetical protein